MDVEVVEVRLLALPLVRPFATATGETTAREVVVVRVEASGTEGWGECAALNAPTYTPEYAAGAFDVLADHLVPRLLAADDPDVAGAEAALVEIRGHPMAKAAIGMAMLDAHLRDTGVSLARHLGVSRTRVPAGVAIGITEPAGELERLTAGYLDKGYRRLKVKVRPGHDLEPLALVARLAGEQAAVVADANGSYGRGHLEHLRRFDDLGLAAIEQPLPEDDLAGHAELAAALRTPVCLDESVTSVSAAAAALDAGAARYLSVKPGRVGGLGEAMRIHDLCVRRGCAAWVGGMLETGIGRAAAVALAGAPGFSLPGDLSASSRYYRRDLVTTPLELVGDGELAVPDGAGLGVTIDPDAMEAATVRRALLQRSG